MIVFSTDYNGQTRVSAHIRGNLGVNYHSKTDESSEFVVIDSYDLERKEWVQVFIQGEALDQFLEKVSVISALRFKN